MAEPKLILDDVYDHERDHPERIFLTQPYGGGKTVDYTWAEVTDQARRMATHLRAQGIGPGAQVAMLTKNCAHHFIAELAIWMAGGTTVSIFPTESADTIRYVLEHSEAKLLFVGKLDEWSKQAPGVPAGLPCIALPLADAPGLPRWDDVIAASEPMPGRPARAQDDLAMLVYTSGSTGTPKGVMHAFGPVSEVAHRLAGREGFGSHDRMLSYLPLAHVYERSVVFCTSLIASPRIYFAETLDTFLADLQRARPTIFVSVPRLWTKFQQGVHAKMPPAKLQRLLKIPILGGIVRRKVLQGLGLENVRLAASGAAPLPPETIEWYRRLGLNLVEGYGMSEDFAYSHSASETANSAGCVGVPLDGVEVRLSDEGEVLVKSPGRMVGYFKQPELTAECLTPDGFFRTGDLGRYNEKGELRLTGRAKELFKTAKGKYVAPAPIENQLGQCPLVETAVVSGVGMRQPYAMIVLAEDVRAKIATPDVRASVDAELKALFQRVNDRLADYEQLDRLVVLSRPFSIEEGTLTPTMKIKRARVEANAAPSVENWYAAAGPVVWAR